MVFLSILEFSLRSTCRYMQSAMSPTTPTMGSTSVGATSKAGPPAGRKASDIAAVIKPTERPRACSWLKAGSRRPMEPRTSAARSASVERVAMIEVAVVEVVAIDDRPAVRNIGVVVVDHNTYISHSRTIINRNNFNHGNFNHGNTFHGSRPGGGSPGFHGSSAPRFQPGTRSGAFSGFDHGGNVRGFSSRGRSSFGGGSHGGGFHGGGGGRHR